MNLDFWNIILFGGGGLTGVISLLLMRSRDNKQQELDMMDRLQGEITRLDDIVKDLRASLEEKDGILHKKNQTILEREIENAELNVLVGQLEKQIEDLKKHLNRYTHERGYTK